MNICEFEEAVWEKDGIRLVVRAQSWAKVENYDYANAADRRMSVTEYLRVRITPKIGNYEVAVVSGDGTLVHGRTKLNKVRATFSSD